MAQPVRRLRKMTPLGWMLLAPQRARGARMVRQSKAAAAAGQPDRAGKLLMQGTVLLMRAAGAHKLTLEALALVCGAALSAEEWEELRGTAELVMESAPLADPPAWEAYLHAAAMRAEGLSREGRGGVDGFAKRALDAAGRRVPAGNRHLLQLRRLRAEALAKAGQHAEAVTLYDQALDGYWAVEGAALDRSLALRIDRWMSLRALQRPQASAALREVLGTLRDFAGQNGMDAKRAGTQWAIHGDDGRHVEAEFFAWVWVALTAEAGGDDFERAVSKLAASRLDRRLDPAPAWAVREDFGRRDAKDGAPANDATPPAAPGRDVERVVLDLRALLLRGDVQRAGRQALQALPQLAPQSFPNGLLVIAVAALSDRAAASAAVNEAILALEPRADKPSFMEALLDSVEDAAGPHAFDTLREMHRGSHPREALKDAQLLALAIEFPQYLATDLGAWLRKLEALDARSRDRGTDPMVLSLATHLIAPELMTLAEALKGHVPIDTGAQQVMVGSSNDPAKLAPIAALLFVMSQQAMDTAFPPEHPGARGATGDEPMDRLFIRKLEPALRNRDFLRMRTILPLKTAGQAAAAVQEVEHALAHVAPLLEPVALAGLLRLSLAVDADGASWLRMWPHWHTALPRLIALTEAEHRLAVWSVAAEAAVVARSRAPTLQHEVREALAPLLARLEALPERELARDAQLPGLRDRLRNTLPLLTGEAAEADAAVLPELRLAAVLLLPQPLSSDLEALGLDVVAEPAPGAALVRHEGSLFLIKPMNVEVRAAVTLSIAAVDASGQPLMEPDETQAAGFCDRLRSVAIKAVQGLPSAELLWLYNGRSEALLDTAEKRMVLVGLTGLPVLTPIGMLQAQSDLPVRLGLDLNEDHWVQIAVGADDVSIRFLPGPVPAKLGWRVRADAGGWSLQEQSAFASASWHAVLISKVEGSGRAARLEADRRLAAAAVVLDRMEGATSWGCSGAWMPCCSLRRSKFSGRRCSARRACRASTSSSWPPCPRATAMQERSSCAASAWCPSSAPTCSWRARTRRARVRVSGCKRCCNPASPCCACRMMSSQLFAHR